MTYVINPLTKRRIRSDGATAQIPAVRERLRGRTFRGNKLSGTKGHKLAVGSKTQVYHGTAHHTVGGITKGGILRRTDSDGKARYVFRSRSEAAKRNPVLMAYARDAKRRF